MAGDRLQLLLDGVDEIVPTIVAGASESERLGCLTPAVVAALHGAGLFRTMVPSELGGFDCTIPESIHVFEKVATRDASTAWTLAILTDGALFARFLSRDAFTTICADPEGLLCGTLNPATARAERVEGGYVFSGRATYLSGSAHSKWLMASALVTRDSEPITEGGRIQVRVGVFPLERATPLDTWHVTGMRATGSNDYEFADVEVESGWTFDPFAPRPAADGDVFSRIPLWSQLGGALASVAVGAATNMLRTFVDLASTKVPVASFSRLADRPAAQVAAGEAEGLRHAAHAVLHHTVDEVWAYGTAGEPFTVEALARQRLGTVTAVQLAARAVDVLHDAAGMSAVASDSVLDRCWRDVHTITQHLILSRARFEIAGRVLLGLEPGSPVI
jgi:alkylation response protein AidB-like acyl-CoA dehydrogenase